MQLLAQVANGSLQRPAVVFLLVRLAVALETAPLIDVKECPSKFTRR